MSSNLILHVPHSSRLILREERAQLALADRTLALELLRVTDTFTDDLFAPIPFEAARSSFRSAVWSAMSSDFPTMPTNQCHWGA